MMNDTAMWWIALIVVGAQILGTSIACWFCDDANAWGRDSRVMISSLVLMATLMIALTIVFIAYRDSDSTLWPLVATGGAAAVLVGWIIWRIIISPGDFFGKY